MASKFASAAEDELACPVCFQFYTPPHEPKNLPKCSHILCEVCLQKMTAGRLKTIKCPQCNKVSTLPEDGIDGLMTSLVVRNLAEKHPTGIKQRKEQIQNEFHQAEKQMITSLKEVKESEKQIQCLIDREEREIKKSVEVIQAQAQDLICQLKSSSSLAEIKQRVAQLETKMNTIQASQSKLQSMSDDEFCSQTDAFANQLRKLHMDTPRINTDQCVSLFIANEHVQLGRIMKPRRQRHLEWIQAYGNFEFVSSVASNSNGLLAVCDSGLRLHNNKRVTVFHQENSQFKIQHKFGVKCSSEFVNIAFDEKDQYLVAMTGRGFEIYSSNGKYQKTVSVPDPKYSAITEIKTTSITTTKDNKILVGSLREESIVADEFNLFVTLHDAECYLLQTIPVSIAPLCIADIRGTHFAVGDAYHDKVCVYDLQSGKETLKLDIEIPTAICYDKHSDCMLIGRFQEKDGVYANPIPETGVIDQYCLTTGKLVACLAQERLTPYGMTFVDDNTLAVTNYQFVKLFKITDTKPDQPHKAISDSNSDSNCDSTICANPSCATPAHLVSGGLKKCARCHIAAYCGKQCQTKHWKSHRTVCCKEPAKSSVH